MGIQRGVAVGVVDVDGAAKATGLYFDAGNVAVCRGKYGQVLHFVGTQVKPHVVVVGAQLAKVAAKAHWDIKGVAEIFFGIVWRVKELKRVIRLGRHCQKVQHAAKEHYRSHESQAV